MRPPIQVELSGRNYCHRGLNTIRTQMRCAGKVDNHKPGNCGAYICHDHQGELDSVVPEMQALESGNSSFES